MKSQLFLFITILLSFSSCTSNNEFYVSPTGNDSNSGTKGKPFLSFSKAREAVAELISNGAKNEEINVFFRGGIYHFDQSVVIKVGEFAEVNNKIIFSAYKDEKPVFSSGLILKGWSKVMGNPPFLPEPAFKADIL